MNTDKLSTHDFWEVNGMFGRDNVICFTEYDETDDSVYASPIFTNNLAQERIALSAINDEQWTPHQWVVSGGARVITGKTTDDIFLNNHDTVNAIPANISKSAVITLANYPTRINRVITQIHMLNSQIIAESIIPNAYHELFGSLLPHIILYSVLTSAHPTSYTQTLTGAMLQALKPNSTRPICLYPNYDAMVEQIQSFGLSDIGE